MLHRGDVGQKKAKRRHYKGKGVKESLKLNDRSLTQRRNVTKENRPTVK